MSSAGRLVVELPGGVRVSWDESALHGLASGDATAEAKAAPWELEGGPNWRSTAALRVLSAAFDDGTLLALAALRGAGARGHGEEEVRGILLGPERAEVALSEILLSTEYDAEGMPRRLGLELWPEGESPALRGAADREEARSVEENGMRRTTATMSLRLDGRSGAGRYEILTRG